MNGPAEAALAAEPTARQLQKELMRQHYERLAQAPAAGRKVVYTFVPGSVVELLHAFDVVALFPEINAVQWGMRQQSGGRIEAAEAAGVAEDVCAYVKCDWGGAAGAAPGPHGAALPPPDLLLLSYTGCFTFVKWFELLQSRFQCPLVLLHVPYQAGSQMQPNHARYVVQQLESVVVPGLEQLTGRRYDQERLQEALRYSARMAEDWSAVVHAAKTVPAPVDAFFDGVYHMGPIATAYRGTAAGVDFYARLRREVEQRVASCQGAAAPSGAARHEALRLVVEGPPNWPHFRAMQEMFADEGAVAVYSTYTQVAGVYHRGFRHDPQRPLETLAEYCSGCYTNLALPQRAELLAQAVRDYRADGFVVHSVKSCKSFSAGQLALLQAVRERTRKEGLFLESDLIDPRYFAAANLKNRLDGYFQMLHQHKRRSSVSLGGGAAPEGGG